MPRNILTRIVLIATLALPGFSTAGATEVVLTHQGRLLDASDQPVTGPVSLTFRIFEAPVGGLELWSESHPTVAVEQGLFIAQLGETIPLPVEVLSPASDSLTTRWLEIQVGGETLTPRQRLGTTPSAASSSRVAGDISTSPGALRIGGMSGSTTGTIRMATTPDSAGITLEVDSDGNGIPEGSFNAFGAVPRSGSLSVVIEGDARAGLRTTVTPDSVVEELSIEGAGLPVAGSSMTVNDRSVARQWAGHSGSTTGTIRIATSPDSTESVLDSDIDGDGVSESSVSSKTKGTKATGGYVGGMSGSTTGTIRMAASPDSTESVLGQDSDGDGVPESSVSSKTKGTKATGGYVGGMSGSTTGTIRMAASPDSTESVLGQDSDGNGIPESSVSSKTKGTKATGGYVGGMSGSTTGTIRMAASPDSTESVLGQDSDGDGVPESSVNSKTKGTRATGALSGMSGSTTGTIRMAASPDSATSALDHDTNNDGVPESSIRNKTSGPRAGSILSGMSGSTTGTIRMTAMPESTFTILGTDTNADLVPENLIVHKSKGTQAVSTLSGMSGSTTGTIRLQASGSGQGGGSSTVAAELDVDGDSDPEGAMSFDAIETRATLKTYFENGDVPTQDNVVQSTCDANGAELNVRRPTLVATTWGAGTAIRVDANGASITMDMDSVPTFTVDDGNAYLSGNLGIGVQSPTRRIEIDGGAYCDGGAWVNGSDVNSKENFRAVDGQELLRKLAHLDITEWNYKGDDGATHIGPMAQDFKKSFGVGRDDKSISTIDPSGIALAAIKALYELNQKQAAEIETLKSEMAKLRKTAQ